MVHRYQYSTINSHHKVLVNLLTQCFKLISFFTYIDKVTSILTSE